MSKTKMIMKATAIAASLAAVQAQAAITSGTGTTTGFFPGLTAYDTDSAMVLIGTASAATGFTSTLEFTTDQTHELTLHVSNFDLQSVRDLYTISGIAANPVIPNDPNINPLNNIDPLSVTFNGTVYSFGLENDVINLGPLAAGTYTLEIQGDVPSFGFAGALIETSAVPVPAAAWLFGSALLGLAGVGRKRKMA